MDVVGEYLKGFKLADKEHKQKEVDKRLVLRGGSVGCVIGQGESCGTNPQEALARYIGYELPKSDTAPFFFAAGFGNEDVWQKNLRKSGLSIITDAEEKITTEIAGYKFSGSPDIRILDDSGKPKLGIELKAVCSASTAGDIFLKRKPKFKHVAQAAIYAHFLNVDYTLIYTSYSTFYPFAALSREYKVWSLPPQIAEFPIKIENDKVYVKIGRKFEETIITISGILKFYESVGTMYDSKRPNILHPRNVDIFGEPETFGGKGELAYDDFYKKVGYANNWPEFIKNMKSACSFIGGEDTV